MIRWGACKVLKETMNWGDPNEMDSDLIMELDAFLSFLNRPFVISCGTNKSHVAHSMHEQGLAVDVQFPGANRLDLLDIFIAACRFRFMGIGLYPDWKMGAGLHLDFRTARYRALWIGVDGNDGNQSYQALSAEVMRNHGMIE